MDEPKKGKKQKNKNVKQDSQLSIFPSKPKRVIPAPGNRVQLITNLFQVSLKAKRPIFRHGILVEAVETQDSKTGPRKLSKEVRVKAVKQALELWLKNNSVDKSVMGLQYKYVLDSNASIMFSLFNMIPPSKGDQINNNVDLTVEILVDSIVEKKLVEVKKKFKVKFSDGTRLDVQQLVDYCQGKGTKDYSSLVEHIRAINVILNGQVIEIPVLLVMQIKSGASSVFHHCKNEQFPLSPGIYCNRGMSMSVKATESGIALNVANAVVPLYEAQKLTDYVKTRYRLNDLSRGLNPAVLEMLRKDLKNRQVEVLHINYGRDDKPHYKKYRIHDITGSGKDKFTSTDKDGRKFETTVEAYFAKEYPRFKLKFPNLPCIVDNGRKLPMEVCRLVDKQRVARRLDPNETAAMIKEAALKPERHFDQVLKNANNMQANSQSLNDFGMELDCTPIEVEGRELPSIQLLGRTGRPIFASNGEYNIQREAFRSPIEIKKWCLCILVDKFMSQDGRFFNDWSQKFGQFYCDTARSKGVIISNPQETLYVPPAPPQTLSNMNDQQIKAALKNLFVKLNDESYEFAVLLLPNSPDWIYGYTQYLETLPDVKRKRKPGEKCTRTSCIKSDNFKRKIINDRSNGIMFLSNLWLKHNVKMGGTNFVLNPNQDFGIKNKMINFLSDGYLFVSIDVCHPAPGDRFMQSVAAMVGMWDITGDKIAHSTRLRVQSKQRSEKDLSTVEEVGEVASMFQEILENYRKRKGKDPTHIVVLRDGVSEGQFKMVLQYELNKIQNVLSRLAAKPKLACLTVQKRHKIRFKRKQAFITRRGDPDYNIQPGTVVDSKVTHPNDFTFFLAPHKAIQGTSKAPYIYMIYDDIGFDQDTAQAMIHALSYLSPRCNKGTSIPTPINLADLAAERGKNIVISWGMDKNIKSMQQSEYLPKLNAHLANLGDAEYKNTLYYV